MKPNKFASLYPPHPDSPDNIPHYPEWPDIPHADWPHGFNRRWNDTERACVTPYDADCCHHGDSDCLCVTSADMDLWNSYSGLSGLTAFDAESLSAIYEKVSEMDEYSAVLDGYYDMSANSAIWNSAAYVPNIYENLSAVYDSLADKADYSAISAYCDIGKHPDGTEGDGSLKVWTDSLVDYYYGDRTPHDMTIVGDGSLNRPLRVGKDIVNAAMAVMMATSASRLANQDDLSAVRNDINANSRNIAANSSDIRRIYEMIRIIENGGSTELPLRCIKTTRERLIPDSIQDPDNLYYC